MRRIITLLSITTFTLLLVAGPAGAQAQTPTSFTGGPDVSSDVSTPDQPRQATDGSIAPRATDAGGEDDSSSVGVLLAAGAALAVVIVAVAVVSFVRRGRERERVSASV
jgi:hypothetical protein